MINSTRSREKRQLKADETFSSNDQSSVEDEEESKLRTDEDQFEIKRRKLCNCDDNAEKTTIKSLENVAENIVMNPILSNGNKLTWKFENMDELTDEGMVSDKFTFKNIDWKIFVRTAQSSKKILSVCLRYDGVNKTENNWICEAKRRVKLLNQNENGSDNATERISLFDGSVTTRGLHFFEWSELESRGYMKENAIIVEIELDFKYYDFSKNIPNYTDIILNVEDTKFHVNKGLLCSKSEYFYKMFVVDNNNEKELMIENVKVEDFRCFIASFYPFFETVEYKNYEQLIKLATEYKTAVLHKICENHLISNIVIKIEKKIEYADKYDYNELMKACIDSLKTTAEIKKIQKTIEFVRLKDTNKLMIMKHLLNFV